MTPEAAVGVGSGTVDADGAGGAGRAGDDDGALREAGGLQKKVVLGLELDAVGAEPEGELGVAVARGEEVFVEVALAEVVEFPSFMGNGELQAEVAGAEAVKIAVIGGQGGADRHENDSGGRGKRDGLELDAEIGSGGMDEEGERLVAVEGGMQDGGGVGELEAAVGTGGGGVGHGAGTAGDDDAGEGPASGAGDETGDWGGDLRGGGEREQGGEGEDDSAREWEKASHR